MIARRTFLKCTSAVAAGGMAGILRVPLLSPKLDTALSSDALLEGLIEREVDIRALAQRALDIAKSAGAEYADVRINQGRTLALQVGAGTLAIDHSSYAYVLPQVGASASVGVRAVVNGCWGFAGSATLTPHAIERVATLAVDYARDGRHLDAKPWEYAAAPVVPNGHWESPVEIDPFSLPVAHILQVYRDGITEAEKIKGAHAGGQPIWMRSDRLFASSEGSLITQRIFTSDANVGAFASHPNDRRIFTSTSVGLPAGEYGFETIANADLKTAWPKAIEEAERKAALPFKSAEVGRYDVVFSAKSMAQMLSPTGQALQLDRALGLKANDDGTTFAMPPEDILGAYQLGSGRITITGDRSRPHAFGTVGWDEEGVKPDDFTLVKDGVVVDYATTRTTAPRLADWYAKQHASVRSHGCAARTGRLQPVLQLPNLTLKPGPGGGSTEDFIREVKRGYYIETGGPFVDQQLINVQFGGGMVYEVVNGKLGSRVIDLGLQFALPYFWHNVATLGGPESGRMESIPIGGPDADRLFAISSWAVPAFVKQLNAINTGKEA